MKVEWLDIPGLAVLTPARFGDSRGWFCESWNVRRMADAGLDIRFVQDNHAWTAEAGTLRGMHLQNPPSAQAKLVRCVAGRIFDVAVDMRCGSPFRGQWRGVELSAGNDRQLFVPAGFLHGYLTLEPGCVVSYKVDAHYDPASEIAVIWSDPAIAIDWPLAEAGVDAPLLSAKDAAAPRLSEVAVHVEHNPEPPAPDAARGAE